jgi:PmbA protein
MTGRDRALDLLEVALKGLAADQGWALFLGGAKSLTRFANNTIHQNVTEEGGEVTVAAVLGKRMGVATTSVLAPAGLRRCAAQALELARLMPPNPDFQSLPGPQPIASLATYAEATAACTPIQRAEAVRGFIDRAERLNLTLAGAFSTGSAEVAVANTLGVRAFQALTAADLNVVAHGVDSSGYAFGLHRDVTRLDLDALAERAMEKCAAARGPRDIAPGKYTVLLEPPAVGELLEWMGYIGFGARTVEEGTSFMAGRFGQVITGHRVTILDDPLDGDGLAMPFDFEGVPKRRVPLIDRGVARGVVYDSLTAGKAGTESTGHGMPPGAGSGPLPLNLEMAAGDVAMADLVSRIDRGLLVSRFHYVNGLLDTRRAQMTGMTRDATFWIEGGRISHPVKNLRFTEDVLEAFKRVEAVSTERWPVAATWGEIGALVAPALVIRDFAFTGDTAF